MGSGIPGDAGTRFVPGTADEAIARLWAGISFHVAAWCLADPDPTPAVAEAAAVHLEAFRESWLVRQRSSP
jgi:hypothetical protein